VLKFMGDGLLAMFDRGDPQADAAAALEMAVALQRAMEQRNAERARDGLLATGYTLALHAGDILYGNIGGETRLDFTVIGPSVNQTARLSEMHRPLGRKVIISEAVAAAAPPGRHDLVSLGRYMLRGVARPQMLFTLYDGDPGGDPVRT
jgi:adenylate cyclase